LCIVMGADEYGSADRSTRAHRITYKAITASHSNREHFVSMPLEHLDVAPRFSVPESNCAVGASAQNISCGGFGVCRDMNDASVAL
jgi:hypothetical protein